MRGLAVRFAASAAFLVLAGAGLDWAGLPQRLAADDANGLVRITSPAEDGELVGVDLNVKGVAQLEAGEHLWIFVHRTKGFEQYWWPQGEAHPDPRNREWSLRVVLGEEQDIGYEFEVACVPVGETEHLQLERYVDKAMSTGDWRPIRMPRSNSAPVFRTVKKVRH